METIKQQTRQMARRSNDSTLRVSNRVRKPAAHFSPTRTPVKETHENAIVNCTCSRQNRRPVSSNFTTRTDIKFEKVLEKAIKNLKLNISSDFVIVYYSKQERKWKKIKDLGNINVGMTYKLRVYKKSKPKKEITKAVEVKKQFETPIEEKEKIEPVNNDQYSYNQMSMQYGLYWYWNYIMNLRGFQFGNFSPFG
ncbi:unnamed protein product [Blepharisma stoltei]|uniref:Uncharacterized protein n=1 Tax=Blepharisma stoltei TaxID=1481888 RepID=A0AAU9J7X7_9CILI|nr:unnamed protein product [Blepharisma stoltei]